MNRNDPLADCVKQSMQQYFDDLNGAEPSQLYNFFIAEVEKPFLESVMKQVKGNQSRASDILGINRNTLRKKLIAYKML